jgi:hypothetical protein
MMPRVSRKQVETIKAEYDNGVVTPEEIAESSHDSELFRNFDQDLDDMYGFTSGAHYPSDLEELFELLEDEEPLTAAARLDASNGFIIDENGFPVYFTPKQHRLVIEAMHATPEERNNMHNRFLSEAVLDQEYLNAFALS